MECPICYNIIQCSAIGTCTHHFCYKCLLQWCNYGGTKCPICKEPIIYIRSDSEFDIQNRKIQAIQDTQAIQDISCNIVAKDDIIKHDKIKIINFEKEDSAGITLKNSYTRNNSRAPGVIIYKIDKNCKCYKDGLRKNDIIISINNIPCINHKQTISIINNCLITSTRMICTLLVEKNNKL